MEDQEFLENAKDILFGLLDGFIIDPRIEQKEEFDENTIQIITPSNAFTYSVKSLA